MELNQLKLDLLLHGVDLDSNIENSIEPGLERKVSVSKSKEKFKVITQEVMNGLDYNDPEYVRVMINNKISKVCLNLCMPVGG